MRKIAYLFLAGAIPVCAFGQTRNQMQSQPPGPGKTPALVAKKKAPTAAVKGKPTPQQQFVIDVVKSAVAKPEQDPQNRLRVLATAVNVIRPVDSRLAARYAAQGVRIESQLIGSGEVPSASIMETGQVSCPVATQFIDDLPPQRVVQAEQSIIGAVGVCNAAVQAAQNKLDVGLAQGQIAPRALMATAERSGAKSAWSQSRFQRMIDHLPDPAKSRAEAPNISAMYDRMSRSLDKDAAQKSGLTLLSWLNKVEDSPERNLSIKIVTSAMQRTLGKEKYDEALRSDIIAQQTANISGPMQISHPLEDNVSVMQAMHKRGQDQTDSITGLPPILRAKEAAASGFAEGTSGDKSRASKYFDIAFSALDDAWQAPEKPKNLPATIEEVCSAAAQVDYVDALKRAEKLSAPSEQAIGMLAVARAVLGKSL